MNNSPVWLDIYLLCHNRPEQAKIAIESILSQSNNCFRLTVSDNSSDDCVGKMVKTHFPTVLLKQRNHLPSLSHFNICIAEASAKYFCLFHDDDVMGPNFVEEMNKTRTLYPEAIAIGANAWIVDSNNNRNKSFIAFGQFQIIDCAETLFKRYFGRHQNGIAPFPSYIYKTKVIGTKRIPESGGKYADVSWLLSLMSTGKIVWQVNPLMEYHIHGGNDGLNESKRDRLRFLGLLKNNPTYTGRLGLGDYRYFIYKKFISADNTSLIYKSRTSHLRRFLFWQRIRRNLRLSNLIPMLIKTTLRTLKK